jgi:ribonuclease P protein component
MVVKLLTTEDVREEFVSPSKGSFTLPKTALLEHTAITHVLKHKRRELWRGEYFTVLYLRGQSTMRMGCVLTRKKLKSSVFRHKTYRIWKEFSRHHKTTFAHMHFVILLKTKMPAFAPIKVWNEVDNFRHFALTLINP